MSAGDVVIDDHLLLRVLREDEPIDLRPRGGQVFTTGLWYHRLSRALADTTVTGAMSRSLGTVAPQVAASAVQSVMGLPERVGLVSLRTLAWPMAHLLADGVRLNLMSLEALAAGRHLGAELCLAADDDNVNLVAAAAAHGVELRTIAV